MSLFMAVSPESSGTRVLVTDRDEVRLKGRLRCPPAHPRALSWLIEAVALWEGAPVRAVLCAGGPRRIHAATFRADWFPDFGGPLYSLEVVEGRAGARLCDPHRGLGSFRDLKQLRIEDALRARDEGERR
jgi:hypothetical protein